MPVIPCFYEQALYCVVVFAPLMGKDNERRIIVKNIGKYLSTKFFGIAALIAAIALVAAACGNKSTGDPSSPNYPVNPYPEIEKPDWEKPVLEIPDPEPGYFNVTFDAGDYSYNTYAHQTIKEGEYAAMPEDPERIIPGLYRGSKGPSTFLFWVNKKDGTEWDFSEYQVISNIELEAAWHDPEQEPIGAFNSNNIIEKAVAYVKDNPNSEYTLYLGNNAFINTQNIKVDDFNLTLRGINRARSISLASGKGALFNLGEWKSNDPANLKKGMEFSIGENITLKGIQDNSSALVVVGDLVTFNMLEGSEIIGNVVNGAEKAAAVELQQKSIFNMEGGEITGNKNNVDLAGGTVYKPSSAVLVPTTSTFNMKGGSINRNTGGVGELVQIVSKKSGDSTIADNNVILKGNSKIGRIALVEEGGQLKRALDVTEWDPVDSTVINLSGNGGGIAGLTDIENWFKANRLLELPKDNDSLIVSKVKLGDFYSNNTPYTRSIPTPNKETNYPGYDLDSVSGKLTAKK